MDHTNIITEVSELQPFIENIPIEDQGDIFHCGRCKLNFSSFVEFVSHKKDHVTQNWDKQIIFKNDVNVVSLDQPNQIWLEWNTEAVSAENNEIYVSPMNNIIQNTEYNQIQNNQVQHLESETEVQVNENEALKANKLEQDVMICSICQRQFKKKFSYYLHLKSHISKRPFQCVICGKTFAQNSNVKKHMLSHKVWPDGLSKTLPEKAVGRDLGFKCIFCNMILPDYNKLKVHRKEHGHEKVYKCIQKKCSATYPEIDLLISHVKNEHDTVEYHCHICSSVLTSLEDMSSHQQEHIQKKTQTNKASGKYTCIYCGSVFKKHFHLTYHLSTANHSNSCPQCDKSFTTERSLRRHLTLHDDVKCYKCDVCGASFRTKHYLRSHLYTHSKEKSFACTVCDNKFSRRDMLMRHIKIHQPNKRLPCPFKLLLGCKMEYTRSDKLNLHIKSHKKLIDKKKKPVKRTKKITNQLVVTTEIAQDVLDTKNE